MNNTIQNRYDGPSEEAGSITIDEIIYFLNDLIKLDSDFITSLINNRLACNDKILEHPTVQCFTDSCGFLGVLNGIFGVNAKGWGFIQAVLDDNDNIVEFIKTPQ